MNATYVRELYLDRPETVHTDAAADAYLSSLLGQAGPVPDGLHVGVPILGRRRNGSLCIRIVFHGVGSDLAAYGAYCSQVRRLTSGQSYRL